MTHHLDLTAITLDHGSHRSPDEGHCLLEVVSMFAGEPFSDSPSCVSPILRAFGIAWNDALYTADRQQLKQYIPRLVGTAGDSAADERRGIMAADWLIRVHTPAWLRLAGLTEQADRLEALPEIASFEDTVPLNDELQAVRVDAAAVWDAAWDAAAVGAAAKDAVWDTARTAASVAVGAAGGAAARDAARGAAEAAAKYAAWVAAKAAVWDAAEDAAASVAAKDAARDDWDAIRAALRPTVEQLQVSAHDLFSRMIDVATEDRTS